MVASVTLVILVSGREHK